MLVAVRDWFTPENTAVVAAASMGWFIVGIMVGKVISNRRPGAGKPQKRSKKDDGSADGVIEMYVGNLSYEVGDKDLLKEFEAFGKVVSTRIIKNRFNGKSKGFGFVEMNDRSSATAAIRALNGKDLKGRRIVVNEAKSPSRA